MSKYEFSKEGYIVIEDTGISTSTYGVSEIWFQTYDEAISYAISIVSKYVEEIKSSFQFHSVSVFEGSKELIHSYHIPADRRIVFKWNNYGDKQPPYRI